MRVFVMRAIAATLAATAFGGVASAPARAADIPLPPRAEQPYYGEQQYYGPPPVQRYVYQRPPVYYPPQPYYYEDPAVVAVVPGPYYRPYAYGAPVYRYGPFIARGYGRFGRPFFRGRFR